MYQQIESQIKTRYKKLTQLNELKNEINNLEETLKKFKTSAETVQSEIDEIDELIQSFDYDDFIVSIKMPDLINELSLLSGISASLIEVKGKHIISKPVITEKGIINRKIISFTIESHDSNYPFCYAGIKLPVSEDKETLFNPYIFFEDIEEIWVIKDFDDIICNFNLKTLVEALEYGKIYYPRDLLSLAVFNCALKDKQLDNQKVKTKK